MDVQGNGDSRRFRVIASHAISQQIKSQFETSIPVGLDLAFRESFAAIAKKLESNPFEFGEPVLELFTLQIRHGILLSVFVEYAVHREQPVVFLRRVQFLPPAS